MLIKIHFNNAFFFFHRMLIYVLNLLLLRLVLPKAYYLKRQHQSLSCYLVQFTVQNFFIHINLENFRMFFLLPLGYAFFQKKEHFNWKNLKFILKDLNFLHHSMPAYPKSRLAYWYFLHFFHLWNHQSFDNLYHCKHHSLLLNCWHQYLSY